MGRQPKLQNVPLCIFNLKILRLLDIIFNDCFNQYKVC
jgi:hypothetical protein